MKQLLTGYLVNFNRQHKRGGHLLQNRYKSIICVERLLAEAARREMETLRLRRVVALAALVGHLSGRPGWP